jgi:hypothetical protein
MHQKVKLIFQITSLSELPIPQEGDLSRLPVLENGFDNVRSYYLERRSVTAAQQLVYVLNNLYTALVPLLLGAIGACTYVLRLMSQQIADTTFSSTSPIRHLFALRSAPSPGWRSGSVASHRKTDYPLPRRRFWRATRSSQWLQRWTLSLPSFARARSARNHRGPIRTGLIAGAAGHMSA